MRAVSSLGKKRPGEERTPAGSTRYYVLSRVGSSTTVVPSTKCVVVLQQYQVLSVKWYYSSIVPSTKCVVLLQQYQLLSVKWYSSTNY